MNYRVIVGNEVVFVSNDSIAATQQFAVWSVEGKGRRVILMDGNQVWEEIK